MANQTSTNRLRLSHAGVRRLSTRSGVPPQAGLQFGKADTGRLFSAARGSPSLQAVHGFHAGGWRTVLGREGFKIFADGSGDETIERGPRGRCALRTSRILLALRKPVRTFSKL